MGPFWTGASACPPAGGGGSSIGGGAAIRVRPRARPVRSGSTPYSAGRTNAIRMTAATARAIAVVCASFHFDGSPGEGAGSIDGVIGR